MTIESINSNESECFINNDHANCGCRPCDDLYSEFTNHLKSIGFEFIDYGSFRNVYKRNNIVIKIPLVYDGIVDNKIEASVWKKYKNSPTDRNIYLAPCRLLSNGCLMMMAVDYVPSNEKPKWAKQIDCQQVGRYKNRVVAYDYALDVTERLQLENDWGERSCYFRSSWMFQNLGLR